MKKILSIFVLALVFACDPADFGEMNVDPNKSANPNTGALLSAALVELQNTVNLRDDEMFYVQWFSSTQYTNSSNYETETFNFNTWYTNPLMNVQEALNVLNDEALAESQIGYGDVDNQKAVLTILRAYYFMFVTDRWGMVPYSEALQGEENVSPVYDTQQDIYYGLIDELKAAEAMIDEAASSPSGDIIFGGDMAGWEKFSRSMRLTLGLRMSEVDAAKASTEVADAAADLSKLILDNADNAQFTHLANQNYQNPWYSDRIGRKDYAMSETFINWLQVRNDPRLPIFADPTANNGDYVGMPYGITEDEAARISESDVSLPGAMYSAQDAPAPIMIAAQINFALAEAIERNFITGDAQSYYEAGIEQSMRQWGAFDQTAYDAYTAHADVDFTQGSAIQRIAEQKWAALFLIPVEAWSEWRRLDYPALSPGPAARNSSIPVRQGYPNSERDINSANYEVAVAAQGTDDLNTRLWWDVR